MQRQTIVAVTLTILGGAVCVPRCAADNPASFTPIGRGVMMVHRVRKHQKKKENQQQSQSSNAGNTTKNGNGTTAGAATTTGTTATGTAK